MNTCGVDERNFTHTDDAHIRTVSQLRHRFFELCSDTEEVRAVDLIYFHSFRDHDVFFIDGDIRFFIRVDLIRNDGDFSSFHVGQKYLRDQAIESVKACAASDKASAEFKAVVDKFLETKDDTKANVEPTNALIAELEKAAAAGCPDAKAALDKKDYLGKKSVWIFGGDGWAYDIGFGGLDHVLASGENVNVMVFDTEMYSNTGGQASKASNIGEVCQFAAAGKEIGKKSLAEIAMSYGYVYVAQIALGANPAQAVKAIAEAEAYPGPSLIIGYAPCELHGIAKGGMNHCQDEMKKAVKAGYWNLFSFNPANKADGKNPFTFTSEKGVSFDDYQAFLNNEARYTRLVKPFPERAERLFKESEEAAKARYEHLQKLVELYK